MRVRGIRGAITVARDDPQAILAATERLLRTIVERNGFEPDDVASALFTVTPDLVS
ncbi:MAG: chorismate mutase, partial [Candidatus Eremiobacteraeota bacterium]|nr:chorismate mutase [Candidatus Eremiobacteraeota bacterium]